MFTSRGLYFHISFGNNSGISGFLKAIYRVVVLFITPDVDNSEISKPFCLRDVGHSLILTYIISFLSMRTL